MTAKDKLRQAVEEFTELEAEQTLALIASRREEGPVLAFNHAPDHDEPLTPEEQASAEEAWAPRLGLARRVPVRVRLTAG